MKKFEQLCESILITEETQESILQYILFNESETFEDLNEGKIDGMLKKLGLHAKKNKGLIGYVLDSGKTMFNLIKAAAKKDKDKVKEILSTEISQAELTDFILKLDQATLHLISAPVHFIEAVTGWHLSANLTDFTKSTTALIKNAYDTLLKSIKGLINNPEELKLKEISKIINK
jgi:hypothetical protein